MDILSIRVRDVVYSHEVGNHIQNRGHISLKQVEGGVEMYNERRAVSVFIPISNIAWIVYEPKKVGRPKKDG